MLKSISSSYIPGVDGLRAIALLSVLFFHAGFNQWFSGGFVGVDVFFVISGFLITRLIIREVEATGEFSFSRFYYRRCKRLIPALLFTVIFSFLFAFLLFTPQHLQRFGGEVIYTLTSISNFYFWGESGYFNASSDFKPLLHTWSLSVEEQFYIIWPIALVFLLKRYSEIKVIALIFLIMAISLTANLVMQDGQSSILTQLSSSVASWFEDGQATIYYLTPFRVFEFCIGALLVWLTRKPTQKNIILELCMAAGLIMVTYAVSTFDENTIFPSYNALIPCVGSALIIYGLNARYLGLIVSNRLAVGLGLISYSVYLIHWPIIVFYKYYTSTPLMLTEKLMMVGGSILLGIGMYYLVEQPFRKHSISEGNGSKAGFVLTAALSVMVIMIPAASARVNSGWPWRLGKMTEEMAAQIGDSKKFHVDNYGGAGFQGTGWVNKVPSKDEVDIVLLGDSHVRHYAFGLKATFPEKNIYSSSISCLLLPDIARTTPGYPWDIECPKTVGKAIGTVNGNPGSLLIVSHSWVFQVPNSKELSTGKVNKNIDDIISKLDLLKEEIPGHAMVLIGNVPGAGTQDVMGCFARPKYISVDCEELISFKESELVSVNNINRNLKEYASSRDGVYFLDPKGVFCEEGRCFSLINGKIMYSDSSHLSKEGSFYAVSKFEDLIRSFTENQLSYLQN